MEKVYLNDILCNRCFVLLSKLAPLGSIVFKCSFKMFFTNMHVCPFVCDEWEANYFCFRSVISSDIIVFVDRRTIKLSEISK